MLAEGRYEGASAAFRAFLEDQPESAAAWQALAWSHYCLRRFDEALSELNRALKLRDEQQALSIRACILTEKGIIDGNKAAVIEALRLFERLLASTKVQTWHILFNLGNALGALGRHQDAIARYKQAIELEASKPEIWKNLATAYHLIGNHHDEMECFDRALELDPLKPEALASKGVSMMIDFGKPEEAAPLLEAALRSSPELAIRWPPIWYWLGLAYKQSSSLKRALAWVQDGLNHQPGNRGLRRLKSGILDDIVTQCGDLVEDARRFWRLEIADQPSDYTTRSRLARLEAEKGDPSAAWNLLDECFGLLKMHPATSLKASRFDLLECIAALKFLPQYLAYRESHPISDNWNREDPLYDLPSAPPHSNDIADALVTFLSIPFGLGSQYLEEHSSAREAKENLAKLARFFDALRVAMEHAVVESSRILAAVVPQQDRGVDAIAGRVTEVVMFLGLVSLREFGRQRGWMASQFRISHDSLTGAMETYDEAQIGANVISKSIITINEEIKVRRP
jgi:tetratricopeptide (TPR) repeat protein